jgi:histidine ammonia-lyase
MGSIAAQKCYKILQNLENVLAIELMTAAQGIEFLKPLKCGEGTSVIYNEIRKRIPPLDKDRILYNDIQKILPLVKEDILLEKLKKKNFFP